MLNFLKEKNSQEVVAYVLMILVIFLSLIFHVVPALISGLLAYSLTTLLMIKIRFNKPSDARKEKLVGITVGIGSFALIIVIIGLIVKSLSGENILGLIDIVSNTLNQSRDFLPKIISDYIPDTISEIKETMINEAKKNISSFANFGKQALYEILLVAIGWIIGILIACKKNKTTHTEFSKTWSNLWSQFEQAFKFVVFAQVKVAAFNSLIMIIFLFVISPLVGWDIPYSKTLVLITFFCGLLPIVGNLISNSLSFILAMTVSLPAAITALALLMIIHKLEYLIISQSLGSDIDSDIWELLIVLFSFEIIFGLAGMVFSPILYAFFKREMRSRNWLPK
jgi:predicted PurR-regulated permease PerM